jgi:hypothetical protein
MQVKVSIVLEGCHANVYGRHFVDHAIGCKILMVGYWWPSLFKDLFNWVKHCDACQEVGKHLKFNSMILVPILSQTPFEKWCIDFVGPITPTLRNGKKRYILVAIEYVTK